MKNILFLSIILLIMTSCASTRIHHLSPDEFIREYEYKSELALSMNWNTYIGSTNTNVYIETGSVSLFDEIFLNRRKFDVIVVWTEVDGLPKDFIERLEKRKKQSIEDSEKSNILYDEIFKGKR